MEEESENGKKVKVESRMKEESKGRNEDGRNEGWSEVKGDVKESEER